MKVEPRHEEQDELGQEMSDNARVWREYTKQSSDYDNNIVNEWNRTADIILLFAALFSAVVTAFTIESYKLLSPNPQDITNALLLDISQSLRSPRSDGNGANLPAPNGAEFQPSPSAIWINALWFTALTCSLGVGSVAMLVKQWLSAYLIGLPSAHHLRAQVRQYRYDSLRAWHTQDIINCLPLGLSLCLILFLTGLAILLFDLNQDVALISLIILTVTALFHSASVILPAICNCPWKTAISPMMHRLLTPLRTFLSTLAALPPHILTFFLRIQGGAHAAISNPTFRRLSSRLLYWIINFIIMWPLSLLKLFAMILRWAASCLPLIKYLGRYRLIFPPYLRASLNYIARNWSSTHKVLSIRNAPSLNGLGKLATSESADELSAVREKQHLLDARAILWLIHSSNEKSVIDHAIQAVSGLPPGLDGVQALHAGGAVKMMDERLATSMHRSSHKAVIASELYLRGLLRMRLLLRCSADGLASESRTIDSNAFKKFFSSPDHPAYFTAICANGLLNEIIDILERCCKGKMKALVFHQCLMLETLSLEIACRKGPNDDHWTNSQSGGWSQLCKRVVPTLVRLLDVDSTAWPSTAEPQSLDASIAFTLAMFTKGRPVVDINVYMIESNRIRDFHYLVLTGLSTVSHFPSSFGCETEELQFLVHRKFAVAAGNYVRRRGRLRLQDQSGMTEVLRSALFRRVGHGSNVELLVNSLLTIDGEALFSLDCRPFILAIDTPSLSPMLHLQILIFLEKLTEECHRATELVVVGVIRPLVKLVTANTDSVKSQAFRVLGRIATRAILDEPELQKTMIDDGLLKAVRYFFSNPTSLNQEDLDIWISTLVKLLHYKTALTQSDAIEALVDWSMNNWRGTEMMVCHRKTLSILAREVGVGTKLMKVTDWFHASAPRQSLFARTT